MLETLQKIKPETKAAILGELKTIVCELLNVQAPISNHDQILQLFFRMLLAQPSWIDLLLEQEASEFLNYPRWNMNFTANLLVTNFWEYLVTNKVIYTLAQKISDRMSPAEFPFLMSEQAASEILLEFEIDAHSD